MELIKVSANWFKTNLVNSVDARELHAFLEVGRDFSNWIKDRINDYDLVDGVDYVLFANSGENPGRPKTDYLLFLDAAKELSMVERNEKGKEARKYFIECEKKLRASQPNFSNPAEAARAWADEYERRLLAEATKAEIGSRREATAMNTASQATKKANALEIQLDLSKEYATIKRMEMKFHGTKFEWRKLKSASTDLGIDTIQVFDQNYGTVNAYHKSAWAEAYAIDID